MDRRIRQVAGLLTGLLLAVALAAGWIQGIRAEEIANRTGDNPREPAINPFRIFRECRWERGSILSADNQVLAQSLPTDEGRRCRYERKYPSQDLVPHVVGQWSLHFGRSGLEAAYNEELVGEPMPPRSIADVFTERARVGNVLVSTIDTRLQRLAVDELRGRRGGVVALNPKTGAVLVAASVPSYDPNPLAANDRALATRARCALGVGDAKCDNPGSPMVSVALQARRPPGSSFKVVTAAAALESGKYTPTAPRVGSTGAYRAPGDTRDIHNFGGGSCGGNLTQALQVSCNTAFAKIAVDVGDEQLLTTARAMGLDALAQSTEGCSGEPISDIRETRTGCLPEAFTGVKPPERVSRPGYRARAGFGQWRIQTSPFGMAVVAATIANGGFVPRPRFADRFLDPQTLNVVREVRTGIGSSAMSTKAAAELTQMMRRVVTSGTGAFAFRGFPIPVAGKTGTAQQGPSCSADEQAIFGRGCGRLPHAWFIAFAPVDDPTIAIAVLVERGGGNNEEATGGRVAAPIAQRVLDAYFRLYPAAAGTHGIEQE